VGGGRGRRTREWKGNSATEGKRGLGVARLTPANPKKPKGGGNGGWGQKKRFPHTSVGPGGGLGEITGKKNTSKGKRTTEKPSGNWGVLLIV